MLIQFSFGLIFWMTVSFLAVLFILKKFAWKPILGVLSERERTIEDALSEAKKAREEIAAMNARNEDLMRQAREEREVLLKEARDIRDKEIGEAKAKAKAEAEALLSRARWTSRTKRTPPSPR
jgi:F-type H+-transporting ATPase subunit b